MDHPQPYAEDLIKTKYSETIEATARKRSYYCLRESSRAWKTIGFQSSLRWEHWRGKGSAEGSKITTGCIAVKRARSSWYEEEKDEGTSKTCAEELDEGHGKAGKGRKWSMKWHRQEGESSAKWHLKRTESEAGKRKMEEEVAV